MSGIKGLLKYRYKGSDEKLTLDCSQNGQGSQSSSSSTLPGSPPDTPIGNIKRFRRGVAVIDSDDSDNDSPVKKPESPWMSKQQASNKQTNGHSSSLNSSQSSSFSSSQDTWVSSQDEERDFCQRLKELQQFFPSKPVHLLREATRNTLDVESATDYVINRSRGLPAGMCKGFKRKYSGEATSPETQPCQYKRLRKLPSDDSLDGDGNSLEDSSPDSKLRFLAEAFPHIERSVLKMTLEAQCNSIDLATIALSTFQTGNISQTKNVGSIKAYKMERARARTSSAAEAIELSDSDSEADVKIVNGPRSHTQKRTGKCDDDNEDNESETYISDSDEEVIKKSSPVLTFFCEATSEELRSISGCSAKKAELIVKLRPYNSWEDLVEKFHENARQLPYSLIIECQEILKIRKVVERLMERCQRLSSEMASIISDLTASTSLEGKETCVRVATQPSNLNKSMTLKPYQMIGLNWLTMMHTQELNGILGDEMGLGKTIQTIAFFAHLLLEGDKGPHVVIAPCSTIDNWLRELQLWCPDLKVLLYYGSQEERRDMRHEIIEEQMDEFNVLLTTYTVASGSAEDRSLFKKVKFHYSVFDEGHMLKNMSSIRYQSLMKIRATRRLLLTGTPLQNNLLELMSLLCFTMPDMFSGKTEHIKKIFNSISKKTSNDTRGAYEEETIAHAKRILKPFFLRRLKTEVLKQLPRKVEVVERVPLASQQQELYDSLRIKFMAQLAEKRDNPDAANSGSGGMLMQLRKAANHQLLHRSIFDRKMLTKMAKVYMNLPGHEDKVLNCVLEDMELMSDFELHNFCKTYPNLKKYLLDDKEICDSGKFRHLDKLLGTMKEKRDRVLLFSQFTMVMDIIQVYLKKRNYKYIRLDGATPTAERQELIDQYNEDDSIFIFLLSTKAGGMGINLTAANVVILHDIDYNPYNDKQAEDRCHRVGQTREVTVYRLIAKDTVEETMLKCGQFKLQLEEDVTGSRKKIEEPSNNDVASMLQEALATVSTSKSASATS